MEMIVISPSKLKIMLTPPDMQRYDLPSEALDCTDEMGAPCRKHLIAELMGRGVWLTARVVPNGDHCEACWEEQLPFFMNILLYERE